MKRTVNNNRDVSSLRSEVEELIHQAFKKSRKFDLVRSLKQNADIDFGEYYPFAIITIALASIPENIAVKTVLFAFVSFIFCMGKRFICWKDRACFGLLEGFVKAQESSEESRVPER